MLSLATLSRRAVAHVFEARRYAGMTRAEAFTRIHRINARGSVRGRQHSGRGSDDWFAVPYAWAIRDFLHDVGARSVVDLGCGDFRVGARLVSQLWTYTGVEIVDELVEANQRFAGERVSFVQGDICEGGLPPADVCLVRQVLQHLPNDDILCALPHLARYRYVVVTEHLPVDMVAPNRDRSLGPGIRASRGSGVVLDEPPFGWPAGTSLLRLPANWTGTQVLETTIYEPALTRRSWCTWDDTAASSAVSCPRRPDVAAAWNTP